MIKFELDKIKYLLDERKMKQASNLEK